jgi:tetratricopeptide (TPR) repeat protein
MKPAVLDPLLWKQISDCFDEVFELEPREREHRLNAIAVSQPSIARMVRELLAEHENLTASGFLEGSALPPVKDAALDDSMAGRQIGGYTIEHLIGRGGMGAVWLASRSDGRFEGRCAIKFIDSIAVRPYLGERFAREGWLLARLNHPHIARLIDAGTTEDGKQFLVLEYVDGERIDMYCESHQLTVEARVRLFLDAVSAVAHAHSQLVIHRDLKPSNVLVTRDGVVKLLDFGIAKLLTGEQTDDAGTHTRFEDSALTPEYAAPEQLVGEIPSTATDVYQLGMLLYVLLTGGHPLRLTGNRAERIRAALDRRIPHASEFATGPARKLLRGDLDAILSMALRKDPRERYATAAALGDDLRRCLNREPVTARRGAALYYARKFIRRHRFPVLAAAVAVTSLCAALVFAFAQARIAVAERDKAWALAARNQAVTEFLGMVVTEAAESDKPVTVSEMLARSERLALTDTRGNRETRAAVLGMLASDYQALGDYGRAARLRDRALEVLGASPDHDLRSELICNRAFTIAELGQVDEAVRAISRELANPETDPVVIAECMGNRAGIAIGSDDREAALRYATEALARIRSTGRVSVDTEVNFLLTVADAYDLNGRHQDAFDYYAQVLRKLDELGRGSGPTAILARNNWAVASSIGGMPKRALQLYDETLRILAQRDPGRTPPDYLLINRARALERIGRFSEALSAYQAALPVTIRSEGKYEQVNCLLGLAATSLQLGDKTGAGKYLDRAAERLGSAEPAGSAASMKLALERAKLVLSEGRFDEARALTARALSGKGNEPTRVDVQLVKAEAELLAGDAESAAADAQLALNVATSLQGGLPYSVRSGVSWLMLGRALQKRGDDTKAHEAFEAAVRHLTNTVDADHPGLVQAMRLAGNR